MSTGESWSRRPDPGFLVGACAVQGLDQSLSFGDSIQIIYDNMYYDRKYDNRRIILYNRGFSCHLQSF